MSQNKTISVCFCALLCLAISIILISIEMISTDSIVSNKENGKLLRFKNLSNVALKSTLKNVNIIVHTKDKMKNCNTLDSYQFQKELQTPVRFKSFSDQFVGGGMSMQEKAVLSVLYSSRKRIFEWGMGSSSLLAIHMNISSLFSVDSSYEWVKRMKSLIDSRHNTDFEHIDIGPIKDFGHPVDMKFKFLWPNYSLAVTLHQIPFDVYLVDGRFRVACACQALLHAHCSSLVVLHDSHRDEYKIISTISTKIAQVQSIAVFVVNPSISIETIQRIWEEYKFDQR